MIRPKSAGRIVRGPACRPWPGSRRARPRTRAGAAVDATIIGCPDRLLAGRRRRSRSLPHRWKLAKRTMPGGTRSTSSATSRSASSDTLRRPIAGPANRAARGASATRRNGRNCPASQRFLRRTIAATSGSRSPGPFARRPAYRARSASGRAPGGARWSGQRRNIGKKLAQDSLRTTS